MGKLKAATILITLVAGINATSSSGALLASELITLGTGGVTGVYYPTGGAICRLVNKHRKQHGIRCAVESTDGSSFNIEAIRAGDLDMGIVQSDVQASAYEGTESFADKTPFKRLRSIFSVYAEPLHLLTRADSSINTFMDVKGKRVNIGNPGSGQRATVELILAHLGWDATVFSSATELNSAKQSQALCDNKIDAVFFTVGVPNGSIKEATRTCGTRIVPLAGPWVDTFVEKYPAYARTTIPGGIYKGTESDVATFESRATVVSSTRIKPDIIFEIVKAVFERFDNFKNLHPAFARLKKPEMVRNGLSAPMHKGAIRYFTEAGLM